MLKTRQLMFSLTHGALYELIPEDHLLKRIAAVVDFSFANEKFADSYCQFYGRPAKEPELMLKLLFLQYLYDLSDERIMAEVQVNLAYKWFAGLNPEDRLPDPSVLSRFRTERVAKTKESAQQILDAVVQQCVEKGFLKEKRLMAEVGDVLAAHLETVVDQVKRTVPALKGPLAECIRKAEKLLADDKRLQTNGPSSDEDLDARVGRKSKTHLFFGYKAHMAMTEGARSLPPAK